MQTSQKLMVLPEKTLLHERFIIGPTAGNPTDFLITYIAYDKKTERKVIVRELFPSQIVMRGADGRTVVPLDAQKKAQFAGVQKKFLLQANEYPIIESPAIFSGVAVFEEFGTVYQITDYVTGIPLATYLETNGGKIPENEALRLFLPLIDGVRQFHEKGFVHGYISPECIKVERIGDSHQLVLINLAIPRKPGLHIPEGFFAPETAAGQQTGTKAADIYGLAAVMYYALCGEAPPAASARSLDRTLPGLSTLGDALTSNTADAVRKGLAFNANERCSSAGNIIQIIRGEAPAKQKTGLDALKDLENITEADESLFEGIEVGEPVVSMERTKSGGNSKLIFMILGGFFLVILVLIYFFIIAPIFKAKNDADAMMQEFMKQVEEVEGTQSKQLTDEPKSVDTKNLTQRDAEVQQLMTEGTKILIEGDVSGAIAKFKKATELSPNNIEAYIALGTAYTKNNQAEPAITAFEKVTRLNPNHGQAYGNLGNIYYDTNRKMRAYDYYRKAVKLGDSNSIEAVTKLAREGDSSAQRILTDNGRTW